jgi:hypothetical protein
LRVGRAGRSRRRQPHEFHCRRICHERRKRASKKFTFCSSLAQGAAASENTAKTAGRNRSPRHCERSDAIHLSTSAGATGCVVSCCCGSRHRGMRLGEERGGPGPLWKDLDFLRLGRAGRSRGRQPHEFHCRRICHDRRKRASESSLFVQLGAGRGGDREYGKESRAEPLPRQCKRGDAMHLSTGHSLEALAAPVA